MDVMTQLYISLAVLMVFALIIVLIFIAGKDILFAFYRRFRPKGCDVFVLNSNKQFSHHYKVPKDGVFKIDDKMYITNPEKVLHLSDDMIKEVKQKMDAGRKRLLKRIDENDEKINKVQNKIESLGNDAQSNIQKQQYMAMLEQLQQRQSILKTKLDKKEHSYYFARRGSYLYIESDPVPKDLYEFFTEMDSVQLENVIVRAQTKDPKNFKDLEKNIARMTTLIYAIVIGLAIVCFIVFKNSSMLESMGGTFTV